MPINTEELKIEALSRLNTERIVCEIAVQIKAGVPYIDAVIDYAEKNGVEIEVIGEIIRKSPMLKAKIYREAEELNMIEKVSRLPGLTV